MNAVWELLKELFDLCTDLVNFFVEWRNRWRKS